MCLLLLFASQFLPPGEIVEGMTLPPEDNPFARLFGKQPSTADILSQPVDIDLNDARSYDRQIYDQVRRGRESAPGWGVDALSLQVVDIVGGSCSAQRPELYAVSSSETAIHAFPAPYDK